MNCYCIFTHFPNGSLLNNVHNINESYNDLTHTHTHTPFLSQELSLRDAVGCLNWVLDLVEMMWVWWCVGTVVCHEII